MKKLVVTGGLAAAAWMLAGAPGIAQVPDKSPDRGLPYSGFFLIKDGKVTLLGGDKDNPGNGPNGIAVSPDERHLYVTAGASKTMRYDVLPDDTVANPVKLSGRRQRRHQGGSERQRVFDCAE
jgi:sugar lactone lactonase YvrE